MRSHSLNLVLQTNTLTNRSSLEKWTGSLFLLRALLPNEALWALGEVRYHPPQTTPQSMGSSLMTRACIKVHFKLDIFCPVAE
jgi:hypothetical protein